MQYVCFILNRMSLRSCDWKIPHELLIGQTPDISMVYRFAFWDRVFYANPAFKLGNPFHPRLMRKLATLLASANLLAIL